MTIRSRHFLLGLLVAVALLTQASPPAFAQGAFGRIEIAVPDDDDDDEEELVGVAMPAFRVADENFDQWLFAEFGNAAGGRSRLDSLLNIRVEAALQACQLTEEQRQKLQLAGRGDIKLFFDRVEELRRKFQKLKTDQNRIQEIFQALQPLQATLRIGPFDESSIFAKAMKRTLSVEQFERFETADRERRAFRYREVVERVVASLDENLSLRAAQRRQLTQLLLAETRAPAAFGQYDLYVVLAQAARLPEERLKPIFDEPQWKLFKTQLDQARGLEHFLKTNGLLPDGGADAAPRAGLQPAIPLAPPARVIRVAPAGF